MTAKMAGKYLAERAGMSGTAGEKWKGMASSRKRWAAAARHRGAVLPR
jgi:hypothetical protein